MVNGGVTTAVSARQAGRLQRHRGSAHARVASLCRVDRTPTVPRESVPDQLFTHLQAGIIDGHYPAGSFLPSERDLARLHGMNRQPVREALQRLRQQRLVEIVQGEGVRVRDWPSEAHLSVLLDAAVNPDGTLNDRLGLPILRLTAVSMIETARLAAQRRTDDQAHALRDAASAHRRDAWDRSQLGFWLLIVEASGCLACRLIVNSLTSVITRLNDSALTQLSAGQPNNEHRERLAEAIFHRDAMGAEAAAFAMVSPVVIRVEGRW